MDSYNCLSSSGNTFLETTLETSLLDVGNICSIFEVLTYGGRFLKDTFVIIKQDKLFLGPLPDISPILGKAILASGTYLADGSKDSFIRIFQEQRKIFIVIMFGECRLIDKSEMSALLESKINRRNDIIQRKVDFDILVAVLSLNLTDEDEMESKHRHVSACEFHNNRNQQNSLRNKNIFGVKSVTKEKSKLSYISPRKYHGATRVPLEEICAHPNDSQDYKNTIRYEDEKYPVQVTETDAGQSSLEPSVGYRYSLPARQEQISESHDSANRHHEVKPPRYPDYVMKRQRVSSFQTSKWARDIKPDVDILAEWGFFFIGKEDLVRCYQCGIGLKDWMKDDDVLNEHVKHSSSCEYLVRKLGQRKISQMKVALSRPGRSGDRDSILSNNAPLPYKIRSPRYQTMEARIASFKNFPTQIKLPHQAMAVSGLFYTGNADLCRCFTCDGGLKDWSSGDDPIKEHATYFSHCAYINKLKGSEYVQAQQRSQSGNMGASGGNDTNTQPAQTPLAIQVDDRTFTENTLSNHQISQMVQNYGYSELDIVTAKDKLLMTGNKYPTAEDIINTILDMNESSANSETVPETDDIQTLLDENTRLSELVYCKLCITNEADILFLPCTHHRICHECASDVSVCPVCNRPIRQKVKTFRS